MPPPAINATPADPAANSYCTQDEATAYNSSRLFTSSWTSATSDDQIAALLEAARLLDSSFRWTGRATTDEQYMAWPRLGMYTKNGRVLDSMTIPQQLKEAQAEFARQLLDADRTADNDAFKGGIKSLTAGPVKLDFHDPESGSTPENKDADVRRQDPVFDYLARWVPDAVRNLLVITWWKTSTVTRPLIFQMGGGGRRGDHC